MDRERFSGCLIGQCLGDALGFPVEGLPPEHCLRYVEETMRGPTGPSVGRGRFPFGQYSDDSQLARELLQSYASCGRFDPEDYARRIAAIFAEDRIIGRGLATEQAARRLAQGVPWHEAGTPSPAAGNGSAMRAGPVGLLFHDDPARLGQVAYQQGRITHLDPRCSAGAAVIANAVALALRPETVDAGQWADRLSSSARPFAPEFAEDVMRLPEWVRLPPERAVEEIRRRDGPAPENDWPGISPFVVPSVLWSLYAFLRTPEDYWETMCTAIEVGGDVDTTAAMAGAISGARVGLRRLPLDLASRLTDQGTWGHEALIGLAHRCHFRKHEGGVIGTPDAPRR